MSQLIQMLELKIVVTEFIIVSLLGSALYTLILSVLENMVVFCLPYEHSESLFKLFPSVACPDPGSGAF